MAIDVLEYRGVTVETMMEVTGLQNPWSDQSRFSLARQKELLLKEAKKQNLLHKIKKSHPKEYKVVSTITDKDLEIITCTPFTPQPRPTHILNFNQTPHKVIRENSKVIIEVRKEDIPNHVFPKPGPGYAYHVIGILAEEKCYRVGVLHDGCLNRIGSSFKFGFHNKVTLHILD